MMRHEPERHHRRSIRLRGYDYALVGAYFVTIVTQDRLFLFGEIVDEEMRLNNAGRMVEEWWEEIGRKFPNATADTHIVMSNHFHGIIMVGAELMVGADLRVSPVVEVPQSQDIHNGVQGASRQVGTPLPRIVQWSKTMTTNAYIRGVKSDSWTPFIGRLWQRNYYEHIIRDEIPLQRIQEYILHNPAQWAIDLENPTAVGNQLWREKYGRDEYLSREEY